MFALFDYIGSLNDKEDDKDKEKEEHDVIARGKCCLLNYAPTIKRFGMECKLIVNILKTTNKKSAIQEYTIHGRLKE
jgi:hypothetical protein